MDEQKKLELLCDLFEEDKLEPKTELDELDAWDSMGRLSLIAMFDDECEKKLTPAEIREFKTVKDIMDKM